MHLNSVGGLVEWFCDYIENPLSVECIFYKPIKVASTPSPQTLINCSKCEINIFRDHGRGTPDSCNCFCCHDHCSAAFSTLLS